MFMARLIHQLTEAKIRTLTEPKLHPDGAGLYLQIKDGGARSWIFRFKFDGRTRDMGLGALADVTLVRAREKVSAARAVLSEGLDPIEHTRAQRRSLVQRRAALGGRGQFLVVRLRPDLAVIDVLVGRVREPGLVGRVGAETRHGLN
jgi:hypothetical protein